MAEKPEEVYDAGDLRRILVRVFQEPRCRATVHALVTRVAPGTTRDFCRERTRRKQGRAYRDSR